MKARKLKLQSLIWPVLFLIAGIITSYYDLPHRFGIQFYGITLTFIVLLVVWTPKTRSSFSAGYVLCLGLFYLTGWGITSLQADQYKKEAGELSLKPSPQGTIAALDHFSRMDRISVRLRTKHWWSPPHYFKINLLEKNNHYQVGQTIRINRRIHPITSSSNPFTFQAKEYWELQNTSHELFLYNSSSIGLIQDHNPSFIRGIRENTSRRIDNLYTNPSVAGILKALLLGQKEAVSREEKNDFKKAGLMHILAVSGLHVGIVSALLFILFLPVRLIFPKSWVHYGLVVCSLWMYAGLTGLNTPVVRAVILMTFYLTARRIDRQIDKWNIYFWAVLLILVIHPTSLFTVSFQLSFGAVASILLFYKEFHLWVKPLLGDNYFSGLVAVSLAAQLGIFPLLLFHFQEVALVSTLSSFLVIPLLFPLILFSTVSLIVPASVVWLSVGLSQISRIILELIMQLTAVFAGWEISSQVFVWSIATLIFIFLALLLVGLFLETEKQHAFSWLLYGALGCIVLAGFSEVTNIYQKRNQAVLAVYKHDGGSINELYYRGMCYTDFLEELPFLIRNRKKYYTVGKAALNKNFERNQLIQMAKEISAQINSGNTAIRIIDYVQNTENIIDISSDSKVTASPETNLFVQMLTSKSSE